MRKEKYKKEKIWKKWVKEKKFGKKGSFSELGTCPSGVQPVPLSVLRTKTLNKGSARFLLRTLNLPNQGSIHSFLRTPNMTNQGSALSFLKLQTCRTKVWHIPFSEFRTCRTRVSPDPFSELWTGIPSQVSARSFPWTLNQNSELRVKT